MRKLILFILLLPSTVFGAHYFTGLPITAEGWTDFDAILSSGYENARVIFVSSSTGNDGTGQVYSIEDLSFDADGIFQPVGEISAYSTFAAGYQQVRDGYPDILLLKRGDAWTGSIGKLTKSGATASTRIIIGSYGSGTRPRFDISATGVEAGSESNLIVTGIHIKAGAGTALKGVDIVGKADNQLWEDCELEYVGNTVDSYPHDLLNTFIAFRRNIFNNRPVNRVFLFGYGINSMLIEENVFWLSDELLSRRILYCDTGAVTQDQLVVRGNIFFRPDAGIHLRSGGTIDNNLFIQVDELLVGGHGGNSDTIHAADITDNVFAGSRLGGTNRGLLIQNNDGSLITGNIWTGAADLASGSNAIIIQGSVELFILRNTSFLDNIVYGWSTTGTNGSSIYINSAITGNNNTIQDNHFQMATGSEKIIFHLPSFEGFDYIGNRYYSTTDEATWFRTLTSSSIGLSGWAYQSGGVDEQASEITYTAPTRTIAGYNLSIDGEATTEDFMLEARQQARDNWRTEYTAYTVNNYFREGFDKAAINPYSDTTLPTVSAVSIDTTGLALTVTLSELCTGNTGFTISPSGGVATLTYASGTGTRSRVYTISRAIQYGETVSWTYTPGDVKDISVNAMLTDTGSATNNVPAPVTATCSDGIRNGMETGVDCGGSCAPCEYRTPVVLSGGDCKGCE